MGMNIADLAISSDDIVAGDRIPDRFTADFENALPSLTVTGVPAAAVELAIIMHDPDAPLPQGFTHWTAYGIAPRDGVIDTDALRTGPNTPGDKAWSGPQPPVGHGQHHYYFWVYALSRAVSGEPSREDFLADYADAIIEQNRFVGTYSR
ncbi:YbhB/YbcL family Raf kinase inhibitor-like protein [Agrococcus sp. Ld7]|uniref:YbhB/YbcL family Raf kinase inhibitor-like protein n=1 Tax=Agrococcus sp. Ld7 TaxID=649148 RepID=UPI0038701F5A